MQVRVLTISALTTAAALAAQTHAAVLLDPTTVTGTSAIDPAGSQTRDQSAFASGTPSFTPASITQLEGLSGFQAVQTFTGTGGTALTAGANTIAFTNPNLPAIQITPMLDAVAPAGGTNNTGTDINFNARTSSGTSGYTLVGNGAGSSTTPLTAELAINLGSYDSAGGTFTPLASGGVQGVGFMLNNVLNGNTVFASFYDASGNLLGTLKAYGNSTDTTDTGATGNSVGSDIFFGFQTADSSYSIARVVIDKTATSNGAITTALDDFGFTPTPEPASLAVVGGAAVLGLRRRRSVR